MTALAVAILLTLGVSGICSLLEAFILSTTAAEIEGFKKTHPRRGAQLERYKQGIEETSAAILTLNTIANTAGATVVGALAADRFDSTGVGLVSAGLVLGILLFAEIVPKNLGFAYRRPLQPYLVWPIWLVRLLMRPFSWAARRLLSGMLPRQPPTEEEQEEEIRLLAERSAKSGALSGSERDLISNALSLDDISVASIMTPRTVVSFLKGSLTVGEVCRDLKNNIPFARMPVYGENIDDILGVVRRRDILRASSEDKDHLTMLDLKTDALFIPETASGLQALQQFVTRHQQFGVVVDEYGSTAGVITMEDIVEHLLGHEIYEPSDLAVDMRELAKRRAARLPSATPNQAEPEGPSATEP